MFWQTELADLLSDRHFQTGKSNQNPYFPNFEGSEGVFQAAPGSTPSPAASAAGHALFLHVIPAFLLTGSHLLSDGTCHLSLARTPRPDVTAHCSSEGPFVLHLKDQA